MLGEAANGICEKSASYANGAAGSEITGIEVGERGGKMVSGILANDKPKYGARGILNGDSDDSGMSAMRMKANVRRR